MLLKFTSRSCKYCAPLDKVDVEVWISWSCICLTCIYLPRGQVALGLLSPSAMPSSNQSCPHCPFLFQPLVCPRSFCWFFLACCRNLPPEIVIVCFNMN